MPAIERLDDPAFANARGELARLFIAHKADLGIAHSTDDAIVQGVDQLTRFLLERHGRALLGNDTAWLERYRWFADACDLLEAGRPATPLDG